MSVTTLHAQVQNLFERVNGTIIPNNAFIMLNNTCDIPNDIQVYTYNKLSISYNGRQYNVQIKGTMENNDSRFFDCFSILNSSFS